MCATSRVQDVELSKTCLPTMQLYESLELRPLVKSMCTLLQFRCLQQQRMHAPGVQQRIGHYDGLFFIEWPPAIQPQPLGPAVSVTQAHELLLAK